MLLLRRLLATFVPPALVVALAPLLTLPGVDRGALVALDPKSSIDAHAFGVLALGVWPFVFAYGVVELIAMLVRPLGRLRHDPVGRRKLDRAARVVGLLFAAGQGFGVAQSLAGLEHVTTEASVIAIPVMTASLVAGACLLLVIASIVSRQGIVNGLVLLLTVDTISGEQHELRRAIVDGLRLGRIAPSTLVVAVGILLVVALASWLALRPSRSRFGRGADEPATAYRDGGALGFDPAIPIPASTLSPWYWVTSLVSLPIVLQRILPALGVVAAASMNAGDVTFALVSGGLTLAVAVVFVRLLHRPSEIADLASRVGVAARTDIEERARIAVRRSIPTTLAFLGVVLAGSFAFGELRVGRLATTSVVLLVAVAMDIWTSTRAHLGAPDLVSVWQERRWSALPVLRSALAAEGIAARTTGTAVLGLLQTFAPYAPANVLVRQEDAPRAAAVLTHLFTGGAPPEKAPAAALAPTLDDPGTPRAIARRTINVGIGVALFSLLLLGGFAAARLHEPVREPLARRAKLEVLRVDDEIEPFANVRDADIPEGIELRFENVPVGTGTSRRRIFASASLLPGEGIAAATARLAKSLATIPLPKGARFAYEPSFDVDPETGASTPTSVRDFVVVEPLIIGTEDVVDAVVSVDRRSETDDVYVAITLGDDGAKRFADATEEWTNRRIAILIDGAVDSAPIVRGRIAGGHISVTMGRGDPDARIADAKRLAHGLSGR